MSNRTKICPDCQGTFRVTRGRVRCRPCSRIRTDAQAKVGAQVHAALKRGDLARQPCEVCGAAKVDAHHDDYSVPLAVRWLCRRHHRQHHEQINRTTKLAA